MTTQKHMFMILTAKNISMDDDGLVFYVPFNII